MHQQRLARHGKDLHELLDALGLEEAFLVGGSMGASSIWAYLDLFGYARCLGMVSRRPDAQDAEPRRLGQRVLRAHAGEHRDLPRRRDPADRPRRGDGQDHRRGDRDRRSDRIEPDGRRSLRGPIALPLLRERSGRLAGRRARATLPVAPRRGARAQFWPAAHATAMAALNEDVEAVVLEGCGHR